MTPRLRRALAAAGGPLLIAGVALFLLRGFWLFGRVSLQHVDPLPFWLPMHCHLGETLASGSIPAWNPHVLGGVPFAADPQSGWMYLPAMLLYAALPCTTAFGWFVTLQPVLAGVGLYWFLRVEGLSRPAATVGGLALAGGIAASRVAVTLPFSGSVAWTAVMLGCAARFFRAPGWSGRLGWSVAVAAAWGQVAAAHLSHGLVVATLALAAYAIAAGGRVRPRTRVAWLRAALLLAALVLVNLAFLAPRVPYLARSTLSLGYGGLDALAADLGSPVGSSAEVGASVSSPWILGFATAPGAYLGMAALLLVPAAWALRERRRLAIWIGAFALLCYLLPLRAVASAVASWGAWLPFADFYVHEPSRFRYGVLLALPILAALGIEAWRRGAASARWVAVGAAAWGVLPLVAGVSFERLLVPGVALAAALAVVWLVRHRQAAVIAVPALLGLEIVAAGIVGEVTRDAEPSPPVVNVPFNALERPPIPLDRYMAPGLTRSMTPAARFASIDRRLVGERGYLEAQAPWTWGLLANQRSMLFGLRDAQGYNPVQPLPYWMFVRAVEPKSIKYNASVLLDPPPVALDLLQVGHVVGRTDGPPVEGAEQVAREGRWALYRLEDPGVATFHTSWRQVGGHREALAAVTRPGFDPTEEVVLEEAPPFRPTPEAPVAVTGGWTAEGTGSFTVAADAPGVLLVRTNHDPNWGATVDGRPARVLRANSFLVGVPVPAGTHRVDLRYDDPAIGAGLAGSAVALALLLAGAVVARRRETSRAQAQRERAERGEADREQRDPR